MTRKEFLKQFAILGTATPFIATLLSGCDKEDIFTKTFDVNFTGKVLIIGAGAAGMVAGYVLNQYNIDFEIIEASDRFGGRIKGINDFADFPIDLGAEWLHTTGDILSDILGKPDLAAGIDVVNYQTKDQYGWDGEKLRRERFRANFSVDYKFKNTSWHNFFETYIIPHIGDRIIYNSPVSSINYSDDKVKVSTWTKDNYYAEKVLVTVPTAILKSGNINFLPNFPQEKIDALEQVYMPDGIKVFIEFSENFYPDYLNVYEPAIAVTPFSNEKGFYNAAFRKGTAKNIMALFTIGEQAAVYTNMATETEIINQLLSELDVIFDGKASQTYIKHIIQNWSKEPYIQGAYTFFNGNENDLQAAIGRPIENKVFFAGEALANYSATVHGASQSAYSAVETILKG